MMGRYDDVAPSDIVQLAYGNGASDEDEPPAREADIAALRKVIEAVLAEMTFEQRLAVFRRLYPGMG